MGDVEQDVEHMTGNGNGRYAFLIFNMMMVAHLLFLVSVAGYYCVV